MSAPNELTTVVNHREADSIRLATSHPNFSGGELLDEQKKITQNLLNHYYMKSLTGWESFMSELEFE